MWRFVALCLLSQHTLSRPTAPESEACSQDALFTSLYENGTEFCESLVDNHCATISTPAPYTSYDSEEISSYVGQPYKRFEHDVNSDQCECILVEGSSTRADATSGRGLGQPTESSEYSPPESSETSSSQASAGSRSNSVYPTETSPSSGAISRSPASSSLTTTGTQTGSTTTAIRNGTPTDSSTSSASGRSAESSNDPADSAEGTAISPSSDLSTNGTATPGSTTASGGPWNRTSGGSSLLTATAGTVTTAASSTGTVSIWTEPAGTGIGASNTTVAMSSRQSSRSGGLPVPTGSTGPRNSTAGPTSLLTPGVPSGSDGLPPLPTGGGGSWNSTATASQTINGTVIPSGPTGSQPSNSTATAGSPSFPVSLVTSSPGPAPAPTSLRTSTGLSVALNSTTSGVEQGNITPLPTGAISATFRPTNTSVGIFSESTGSQPLTTGANATSLGTSTSAPSGLPSSSSSFPGWNTTQSTLAGQITGTAGTAMPTATGAGVTVSPTSGSSAGVPGNATASTRPSTAFGNSTSSAGPIPTSAGQQNETTAPSAPPVPPSASVTRLPTSKVQNNATFLASSTSGAVNSTLASVTALPTSAGTSGLSTSALSNFTSVPSTRTPSTSGSPRSTDSTSGPANNTALTSATPTFFSTTGLANNSSTVVPSGASETRPSGTEIPAANFTEVFRNAAVAQETCYSLPQDAEGNTTRRALVRNSKLRESNVSIPAPYIESIDFDNEGLQPLYMTVRDAGQSTFFLDISNKSRLAAVDESGATMVLDDDGVRFATNSCRYDVNVTISGMFAQLADLSSVDCSFGNSSSPPPPPVKRAEDIQFDQTLYLEDQCGSPVTREIRDYPEVQIGDTVCVDVAVDEDSGQWDFDCTYPGSYSGTIRCQNTVKEDIIDFLVKDAFGGECPDITTMVSTLANSSSDVLNAESFRGELLSRDGESDTIIDAVVNAYEGLWAALQEFFIAPEGGTATPWETFFAVYNENLSFENDLCESLHAGEIPLGLNLRAGATYIDTITTLNWAPVKAEPYNITIQNPSSLACCPKSYVASNQGEESCAYPSDAFIGETGCICGETTSGEAIAYEATECSNFEDTCESDGDCSSEGFVCLTGTCCGGGVCVDPYACSQNGTELVTFDLADAFR